MKIAICDDELLIAGQLEKIIRQILHECDMEGEIQIYQNGMELLDNIENVQIVFLDIDMPGMDGMETGHLLRKKGSDCEIIVATSVVERYKEAFYIQACRFITKPFDEKEIEEALRYTMDRRIGTYMVEGYDRRVIVKVPEKTIQYFRAFNGYVEFYTKERVFRKETTLDEVYQCLDKRLFFKVSRSYIVNFAQILTYKGGVVVIGKQSFMVARRCRKEFEKKWIEFDLHYRRKVK